MKNKRQKTALSALIGCIMTGCAAGITPTLVNVSFPSTATSTPAAPTQTPTAIATSTVAPSYTIFSLHPNYTPPESPFMRIGMYDEKMGWAISSDHPSEPCRLLHTQNGGLTWQDKTPSGSNIYDYTTYFIDAQDAWVVSAKNDRSAPQAIYQTSDGGEHWNRYQDLPFKFPPHLEFADANHGWAMEVNFLYPESYHLRIFETKNGGKTWELLLLNNPQGNSPDEELPAGTFHLDAGKSFEFVDSNVIWFGGNIKYDLEPSLTFLVSHDASKSWQEIKIEIPYSKQIEFGQQFIYGTPFFITKQDAYIPAFYAGSRKNLLSMLLTHDGGQTWTVSPTVLENFSGGGYLQFVSPSDAFLDCGDRLCITHDGAKTWQSIQSNISFESAGSEKHQVVGSFNFIDTMNGWATILNGDKLELIKTNDGGQTWTTTPITITP